MAKESKLKVRLLAHTPEPAKLVTLAAKLCYFSDDFSDLEKKFKSDDPKKFIPLLYEMGHHSPFEHVSYNWVAEGISRSLSHQLVRHRIASYTQRSQRYVNESDLEVIIPKIYREDSEKKQEFLKRMELLQEWYKEDLEYFLGKGIGKEEATQDVRFYLPNATETKIISTMNARQLMHVFKERLCGRAQWEIRDMFTELYKQVLPTFPELFLYVGPDCYLGNCKQKRKSCGSGSKILQNLEGIRKPYRT